MVSTRPLISKSFSLWTNPVLSEPMTTDITVTFMFHSFFNSLARSRYLSFFSLLFCGQPELQIPQFGKVSFFLIITRSGLLVEIRGSVCISKSQRSLCVSFSKTDPRTLLLLLLLLLLLTQLAGAVEYPGIICVEE